MGSQRSLARLQVYKFSPSFVWKCLWSAMYCSRWTTAGKIQVPEVRAYVLTGALNTPQAVSAMEEIKQGGMAVGNFTWVIREGVSNSHVNRKLKRSWPRAARQKEHTQEHTQRHRRRVGMGVGRQEWSLGDGSEVGSCRSSAWSDLHPLKGPFWVLC